MNKYLISILFALTMFTVPTFAESFHNPDGSNGCISSEVLASRIALVKANQPTAFATPILATHEGTGKEILASINTVYYNEHKDQIKFDYLLFLEGPAGPGINEALIVVSDTPDEFCQYIKMDAAETAELEVVMRTVDASVIPQLGPTQ